MRRREFPVSIDPQRLQGLLRGKTWLCHVFPLNNPWRRTLGGQLKLEIPGAAFLQLI